MVHGCRAVPRSRLHSLAQRDLFALLSTHVMLFIILYKPLDLFRVTSMANLLELELHPRVYVGRGLGELRMC